MQQVDLPTGQGHAHGHGFAGSYGVPAVEDSYAHELFDLIGSVWKSKAIGTACKLEIFDHLAVGLGEPGRLAAATGTQPGALQRLLRALASLDLVASRPDGKFGLTPKGQLLTAKAPGSLRPMALLMASDLQQAAWNDLQGSLTAGQSYPRRSLNTDMFAYLRDHHDESAAFYDTMTAITHVIAEELPALFKFDQADTVLDIGGGHGRLLAGVLKAHGHLKGMIYDLPAVMDGAQHFMQQQGLAQRVQLVPGDARESIPFGADVMVLKNVLHMFNDEVVLKILQNAREAIPLGGHLLILEALLPASTQTPAQSQMDLTMLLVTEEGRERTRREFELLLAESDFRISDVRRTSTINELLVATAI